MRIGIDFKDNDFSNTFRGFAKILIEAVRWNCFTEENLKRENIVRIVNDMMGSVYLLFQSHDPWEKISINLSISPPDVYLDEEIDRNIGKWSNRSFMYVDTENNQTDIW